MIRNFLGGTYQCSIQSFQLAVLNTLNVPESGKCGYNDSSTSQVSLTELCKKLGLKVCGENSSKVVSYAASIEILQHVGDIGSSLGNIDFGGQFYMPFSWDTGFYVL